MMEVDALTYADFLDSNRLRRVLLDLLQCPDIETKKPTIKVYSFLRLATPLLNISLVGRMLYSEESLRSLLRIIITFYSSQATELPKAKVIDSTINPTTGTLESTPLVSAVEECVEFVHKIIAFEKGIYARNTPALQWLPSLQTTPLDWTLTNTLLAIESITLLILSVRTLSTDLQEVINNMHLYLSDEQHIHKTLTRYFTWLYSHQTDLKKSCLSAELLESLDKNKRAWLKGEIYETQTQIISIYNSKYKTYLQNLHFPALSFQYHDSLQAIKDITRESLFINNTQIANVSDFEAGINHHLWEVFFTKPSASLTLNTSGLEFDEEVPPGASEQEKSLMEYSEYSNLYFQTIVEIVYSHVLTAASRTVISGDMYALVNDLYVAGGDSAANTLVLCPSHHYELRIDITLTQSSIKVAMKQVFHLYSTANMERPLVSFLTTCLTTIRLSTILSIQSSLLTAYDEAPIDEDLSTDIIEPTYLRDDLLNEEEKICSRRISITPFLP